MLLPTENNSVVGALDNSEKPEGYTLYASLKRKRLSLKIKIEGTNSGEVVIKTKDTFDGPAVSTETCTNRSEGCEYAIYSGKFVEITADRKGDKFSSWKW